jgi:hypothetical protein
MINKKNITSFDDLYSNYFSYGYYSEVVKKSVSVYRLMELIYRPMTKEAFDSLQNRRDKLEEKPL